MAELRDDLATRAAGHARGVRRVGSGIDTADRNRLDLAMPLRHGIEDRGSLRTNSQSIGGILDIGACENLPACQNGCADAKSRIWRVGFCGGGSGSLKQPLQRAGRGLHYLHAGGHGFLRRSAKS